MPDGAADDGRRRPDGGVAGRVTVRIVDFLEIVEVNHQERDGRIPAPRALQLLFEAHLEMPAVEKAAHRIDGRRSRKYLRLRANRLPLERQRRRCSQTFEYRQIGTGERSIVETTRERHDAKHPVSGGDLLNQHTADPHVCVYGAVQFTSSSDRRAERGRRGAPNGTAEPGTASAAPPVRNAPTM